MSALLYLLFDSVFQGLFEGLGGRARARFLHRQFARGKPVSIVGFLLIEPSLTEPTAVRFFIRTDGVTAERRSGTLGTYGGLHAAIEDVAVQREPRVHLGVERYPSLSFDAAVGHCTLYCVPRHVDLLLAGVTRNPSA